MRILLELGIFGDEGDRRRSERVLLVVLYALALANLAYLRAHPGTPQIYESGVDYTEPGKVAWRGIADVLKFRGGDCKDLACWRIAELWMHGIQAKPQLSFRRVGRHAIYHIRVRWPTGWIEDPSINCGMPHDRPEVS